MKFLLIFFLLPILCFGDELSLADLIDIALKNNPETQRVWANVKRAQATVGVAKSAEYPHLSGQANVTHGREVKFPNGPNTIFTNYGGELSLNYLLYDFGERSAAIRATKDALQSAKWWADFSIQKIMSQVAAHYYEYLNANVVLETRKSSLQDAETIFDAAKELLKAGLRSENDHVTAKATISQIRMVLAQQNAASSIAYGKLLMAMGLPMDTEMQVDIHPEGMQNPLFEEGISELIAVAEGQRADLMAKQAMLAEMNARVDRAKRAPLPKLQALGQAGWLQYDKHRGSGYNYSAGLALNFPIFKGFEYTYQKRQALADAEMTAAEIKELQNEIALEVLTYSELAKAAHEALQFSEDSYTDAMKSYENTLESYKAGLINIFDMLQSQRFLAEARNRNAEARTEWLVALSQLAFATGSLSR